MAEQHYQDYPYVFGSKGVVARYPFDRCPEGTYINLKNMESRQENALSSRLGHIVLNTNGTDNFPLPDLNVHTLGHMRGVNGASFRYAGAGQNLYRRAGDLPGLFDVVSGINQLSGDRFSIVSYRPSFSSFPYAFFADSSAMLKDNGSLSPLQQWGIFPPVIPIGATIAGNISDDITDFGADIAPLTPGPLGTGSGYLSPDANFTPSSTGTISTINVVLNGNQEVATVVTSSPHGLSIAIRSGQINFTGIGNAVFNGPWRLIQIVNATTFICARVGTDSGSSSGGQFKIWTNYFRVNTTSPGSIPMGVAKVTPASMSGIVPGMMLLIDVGNSVPLSNVVARPSVLLNGWGPNGHVGDYEHGVDQGHFFGLNSGGTLPFNNPNLAIDGNEFTAATALFTGTHQYAGCVWKFSGIPASANPRILNILSMIPFGVTQRTAGVWYSLNNGLSWTQIYNTTARPKQWDSITLPPGQDISQVQVMAFLDSHDNMSQYVYEINITESSVQVNTGHPEYVIVTATDSTTFTAFFSQSHIGGATIQDANFSSSVGSGVTANLLGIGPYNLDVFSSAGAQIQVTDDDVIRFFMNLSAKANVTSVSLQFDVGDGSFTDFYSKSVDFSASVNGAWSAYDTTRGDFSKNGLAGLAGHTWANVTSFRFQVVTTGVVTFNVDNLYMFAPSQLDIGSGVPYDWRYTYFNDTTGDESNGSVPMVMSSFLSPVNQGVLLTLTPSPDVQVTSMRIYRRGGTLTAGWFFVASVPASTTAYIDTFSDAQIANNNLLQLDNDVPLTTTLPVPVNTFLGTAVSGGSTQTVTPGSMENIFPNQLLTIDNGDSQEIVIVQLTTDTTFTAYFQNAHAISSSVAASTRSGHSVSIAAIAFNQAWWAGDEDNPNRLYYSKLQNPEAAPPQNWIEVGVPDDPIMAIVLLRGQLFVLTSQRIWRVVVFPGQVPAPYPTSSRHGLLCRWAWCIEESQIWYRSADGIYVFLGDNSQYVSQPIEWILSQKEPNLGPIPTDAVVLDPFDPNIQNILMAYNKNEIFYSYFGSGGVQVRMIYDTVYKRWRNDTSDFIGMNTEEDTQIFVCGHNDGMIHIDRVGDVDNEGFLGGNPINNAIPIDLETPALDQGFPKNNKIYNEFTLDLDTSGQDLTAKLIFDKKMVSESSQSFTFNSDGRKQFPVQINNGKGMSASKISLQVTGSVSKVVHLYEWHVKAAVDAEFRKSFDTYWSKQGTDEYKLCKQGYFEYTAQDDAGLSCEIFLDGSDTSSFSFSLSKSTLRAVKQVRFPAFKYKTWRLVVTSDSDFQLYGESFIEVKPATSEKGYAKIPCGNVSAQSNV